MNELMSEFIFAAILDYIMSTPENFNPNVFRDIILNPEPLVYTYVQKNFPELLEEEAGDPGGELIIPGDIAEDSGNGRIE